MHHAWWFAGCTWSFRLTGAAALGLVVLAMAVTALMMKHGQVALRFALAAAAVGGLELYAGYLGEQAQRARTDRFVGALDRYPVPEASRARLRDRGYAEAGVCETESLSFGTPLIGAGAAIVFLALRIRKPPR